MTVEIICADAREALAAMPAGSVHCAITSPPYWGLRDYGLEPVVWGPECEHEWGAEVVGGRRSEREDSVEVVGSSGGHVGRGPRTATPRSTFCHRCNAWRGSLGLEPTPELYVEHIVQVMREVRRVLRDDGVLFLNLGDSYCGSGKGLYGDGTSHGTDGAKQKTNAGSVGVQRVGRSGSDGKGQRDSRGHGSASQSLCGECEAVLSSRNPGSDGRPDQEPSASTSGSSRSRKGRRTGRSGNSRSAFQDAHSEAATSGRLPTLSHGDEPPLSSQASMPPESSLSHPGDCHHCAICGACRDVLASANPYALVCARTGWCIDGTGQPASADHSQGKGVSTSAYLYSTIASPKAKDLMGIPWAVAFALRNDGWWLRSAITWCKGSPMPESVQDRPSSATEMVFLLAKSPTYFYDQEAVRVPSSGSHKGSHFDDGKTAEHQMGRASHAPREQAGGRNLWNWWLINPQPYPQAHFATFPEKLVEPCILAGTSERGGCPECGAPWKRVVERKHYGDKSPASIGQDEAVVGMTRNAMGGEKEWDDYVEPQTVGWRPTCDHDAEPVPCRVLDPFAGSGTVGLVAERLGRHSVLIDASEDYCEMARERTAQIGLFAKEAKP